MTASYAVAYSTIESGLLHLEAELSWDNLTPFLVMLREMEHHAAVDTITVYITSLGGATLAAIAIAQAIRMCRKPVRTIGTGYLASSAVLVLAAGHPGLRALTPGTLLMLHAPRLPRPDAEGLTLTRMREFAAGMEVKTAQYFEELARLSNKPADFWRERLKDDGPDWFFAPNEAVELGLADTVLTP